MKKCLITGCGGFIGSYLAEFLHEKGIDVTGTIHHNKKNLVHLQDKIRFFECNLLDEDEISKVVSITEPDYVFHLGAQSLIAPSWDDPENTLQVNILGTLNLLEAIKKSGKNPLIEMVTSIAIYGNNLKDEANVKEDREFIPSSPYGVSKIAQDMLAHLYWQRYKLSIIRARPFYIIGPGLAASASNDSARKIVEIENGQQNALRVGDLSAVRDVVDVRDCASALWTIVEKGNPGDAYNICSGEVYKTEETLNKLISFAKSKITVVANVNSPRPTGESILAGDNTKRRKLGWKPEFSLEETLFDMLDFWTISCVLVRG